MGHGRTDDALLKLQSDCDLGDATFYTQARVDDDVLIQYRLSRAQFLKGNRALAEHYYKRNREKNCIDIFYEVELPEHVVFVHPLSSVLGRANYGDYLVCYQGVGVGSSLDHERATLGRGVALMPGCKVIGPAVIGDNVFVLANAVINGCDIPSNSLAFGYNQWKPTDRSVVERFFK